MHEENRILRALLRERGVDDSLIERAVGSGTAHTSDGPVVWMLISSYVDSLAHSLIIVDRYGLLTVAGIVGQQYQ